MTTQLLTTIAFGAMALVLLVASLVGWYKVIREGR